MVDEAAGYPLCACLGLGRHGGSGNQAPASVSFPSPECAVSTTSSHSAVLSLSGHSTARTASSRISAAVPGRLPSPAGALKCRSCSEALCTHHPRTRLASSRRAQPGLAAASAGALSYRLCASNPARAAPDRGRVPRSAGAHLRPGVLTGSGAGPTPGWRPRWPLPVERTHARGCPGLLAWQQPAAADRCLP